ncbi:hypothetical protein J6590_075056 [Homalodisca vitripennis]|nr:hypothetical protein J6590_075056 [Homalodisca vitripennis]
MEEVVDGVLVSTGNSGTRKRQASGGKRKEAKRKRYSAPSELKRIAFERSQGSVKVNSFKNYRFEDESEQLGIKLLKKGVKLSNIKKTVLEPLPLSHHISAEKKKDVEKLLKLLYGKDWQNEPENAFKWYKTILYDLPDGNDEEEEVCDCLDNDIGLRI